MSILDHAASERLNIIRFPLIVGVVYIHAYDSVVQFGSTESLLTPTSFIGNFIRDFISGGLAGVAVPLFFFMSGYLFFNGFAWAPVNYLVKLKSRVKTLLVPFLFWNVLWLGLFAVAQNIPVTANYFAGGIPHITQSGLYEIINLLIGIDRHPVAFQFWYIRELMILVLLVPLFHLTHINNKISIIILVILFGLWMSGIPYNAVLSIIPGLMPVFFFYAGSMLAVRKKTPFFLDKYGLLMIAAFVICASVSIVYQGSFVSEFIHKIARLTGVVAALYSTKYFITSDKFRKGLSWLAGTSFFVFAFHEPVLEIVQRLILGAWSTNNDAERLLFYFVLPVLVIAVALITYRIFVRFLPKFTSIITGGRLSGYSTTAQSP